MYEIEKPIFVKIKNTVPYWNGRIGLLKDNCWDKIFEISVPGERKILLDAARDEFEIIN